MPRLPKPGTPKALGCAATRARLAMEALLEAAEAYHKGLRRRVSPEPKPLKLKRRRYRALD